MSRILVAPFSDAHTGVIRALIYEHDHLPVSLYREPDNRADAGAVAVVAALPPFVVGGQPVYSASEHVGQRIGYVSRIDAGKRALCDQLDKQDAPIAASLVIEGPDWWVELPTEPDDQDDDQPF